MLYVLYGHPKDKKEKILMLSLMSATMEKRLSDASHCLHITRYIFLFGVYIRCPKSRSSTSGKCRSVANQTFCRLVVGFPHTTDRRFLFLRFSLLRWLKYPDPLFPIPIYVGLGVHSGDDLQQGGLFD